MRDWNELQQPDTSERALLEMAMDKAIGVLCDIHNRKLSDEGRRHWMSQLMPFATGKAIWKALEIAGNEKGMPSVAWVLEQQQRYARDDVKPYVAPVPLTPEQQRRSDVAAMKSLLWLHYHHGWELERVGKETIGRVMAAQMGMAAEDVPHVQQAAKDKYPREYVLQWMRDQQAAGN